MISRITCEDAIALMRENRYKYHLFTFNDCFGGPGEIHANCQAFIDNCEETNPEIAFLKGIQQFGAEGAMQRNVSKMGTCLVRAEYLPGMSVHEYDGYETPIFDREEYLVLARHLARETSLTKEVYEAWKAKAFEADIFKVIWFRWDSYMLSRHCEAACSTT